MRNAAAAAYLLAVFLIVYGPVVGQGFVADDFGWVHGARTGIGATARTAFAHSPVVTHVAPGEQLLVLDGKTGRLKRGGD